ncbi:MAG: hypothetical protein HOP28_12220 [Gemmatimonadales bacterium]|nr:hypothetical protein [Gemmatimonadales bacterium]
MKPRELGEVSPWEDWPFKFDLTESDPATDKAVAVHPATGFSAWWSNTEDGEPIGNDVKVALVELAGKDGTILGRIEQAAMLSRFQARIDDVIWEVLDKPGDHRSSRPYKIVRIRRH